MKTVAKILAALATGTLAFSALAAEGLYVAADYGQINIGNVTTATGGGFPNSNGIFLSGGYRFSRNLSAEATCAIGGNSTTSASAMSGGVFASISETVKPTVFAATAIGTYPINDQIEVFGKLGIANLKFDYTASASMTGAGAATLSSSASGNNLMFGFGAQGNLSKSWGVRFQYMDFGKAKINNCTTNCDVSAKTFSFGGIYSF